MLTHSGLDAQAHYNLIKDAYFTLGNPNKRADYDNKITQNVATSIPATTYHEDSPGMSAWMSVPLGAYSKAGKLPLAVYALHRFTAMAKWKTALPPGSGWQKQSSKKREKERELEAIALARQ